MFGESFDISTCCCRLQLFPEPEYSEGKHGGLMFVSRVLFSLCGAPGLQFGSSRRSIGTLGARGDLGDRIKVSAHEQAPNSAPASRNLPGPIKSKHSIIAPAWNLVSRARSAGYHHSKMSQALDIASIKQAVHVFRTPSYRSPLYSFLIRFQCASNPA